MSGFSAKTEKAEKIDIEENTREYESLLNFLNDCSEKTLQLDRILGIGGEGLVISEKMNTSEYHYSSEWTARNWANRTFCEKSGHWKKLTTGRNVAIKFVKFDKDENENFEELENEHEILDGGINDEAKFVASPYFERLKKHSGDYIAATFSGGGYSRPYINFGISEIFGNYYYVIGRSKMAHRRWIAANC